MSRSPTSLRSGLEIIIACCTVTFPVATSQSPTHTLTPLPLQWPQVPRLPHFLHLPPPLPILCFLLLISILHSLQCPDDWTDRLYNMSLQIYLTFNISIKCQCKAMRDPGEVWLGPSLWGSFSLILPSQSRQKAKQTAVTSNYCRQYRGGTEQAQPSAYYLRVVGIATTER